MSYSVITERAAELACEINVIKRQAAQIVYSASVEIGRRLCEAKDIVSHGQWAEWLNDNVDYSQSTADNLMRIATEFGDGQADFFSKPNSETFGKLGYSQLVALFPVPKGERAEFAESVGAEELSARQLKDAAEKWNAEKEKLTAQKEKLNEENNALAEECNRWADSDRDKNEKLSAALYAKNSAKEQAEALDCALAEEKKKRAEESASAAKVREDYKKALDEVREQLRAAKAEAAQMSAVPEVSDEERERIRLETDAKLRAEYAEKLKKAREESADAAGRAEKEKRAGEEYAARLLKAEEENRKLSEKAAAAADTGIQKVRIYFEVLQGDFEKLLNALFTVDGETGEKLKGAVKKYVGGMGDRL